MIFATLVFAALGVQDVAPAWLERFQAAEIALEAGAFPEAQTAFTECLAFVPENATVAYHRACLFAVQGETHAALDWLQRAVEWGYADASEVQRSKPVQSWSIIRALALLSHADEGDGALVPARAGESGSDRSRCHT